MPTFNTDLTIKDKQGNDSTVKFFFDKTNGVARFGSVATTALMMGGGTSASPLTTSTADKKFADFLTKTTATSGDSRGMYWKHRASGTIASTGYADCMRAVSEVLGTNYSYVSGMHSTVSIGVGGTIAGSCAGLRATLEAAASSRTLGGTLAALQIDSNIGTGNTLTKASLIRVDKAGSVDVVNFLDIADDQCLKGDGTLGASPTNALKCLLPNGSTVYIPLFVAG